MTRKITRAVANIALGFQKTLFLGNIDAKRDWGHAKDYVKAMYLVLQQEQPDDYVIATGETHSVRELVEAAFQYLDLDWKKYVKTDDKLYRPAEVELLVGDASRAAKKLHWKPKHNFQQLIHMMVDADLDRLKQGFKHGTNAYPLVSS